MSNTKREGEVVQTGFVYEAMKMGPMVLEPFGDSERFDYALKIADATFTACKSAFTSSLVHPFQSLSVSGRHQSQVDTHPSRTVP